MSIRPLSETRNRLGDDAHHQRSNHQADPTAIAQVQTSNRRRRLTYILIAFWLIGIACMFASKVHGQENYKSVPMNPAGMAEESNAKKMVSGVRSFAAGSPTNPFVNLYFTRYIPAVLTNDEYLPIVSKAMLEYHDILDKAERSGTNRNAVQEMAFRVMKVIASDNYPPSARINAITVLSRLDSRSANTSARTPPVPLEKVLPILVGLYQDKNNNDGIRAAALHGIHRHVNYGFQKLPAQSKADLTSMMTELLDSESPPGRSPEAHAYLQRYAVDILEKLRAKGDVTLGEKLISISTASKTPSSIALYSAASVGAMGGELKGKVSDPSRVLKSWSRRALMELESELHRLQSLDRAEPTAGQPPNPGEENSNSSSADTADASSRPRSGGGLGGLAALGGGSASRRDSDEDESDAGPATSGGLGALGGAPAPRRGAGRETRRQEKPLPGENQPHEVVGSRRKLNHALQQLQIGVTGFPKAEIPSRDAGGLLASVADDAKPEIEDWVTSMKELIDQINDEDLTTRKDYVAALEVQIELLRELVGEEPIGGPVENPGQPAADDPAKPEAPAVDELGKL